MDRKTYSLLENFMLASTSDSAHGREHIYRVLHSALAIAKTEENVDYDILLAACLLHDVGRPEQFENPQLCHAEVGSEKAYTFLLQNGFTEDFAAAVRSCILTHRFRVSRPPQSIEAKILFDADKLDVTGAMGIARTLQYKATTLEPLYLLNERGEVSNGESDLGSSFFREYHFKLKNLYDRFYTAAGKAMAEDRRKIAEDFYHALYNEVAPGYQEGKETLDNLLTE